MNTHQKIRKLEQEALAAGDYEAAEICRDALAGEPEAILWVRDWLNEVELAKAWDAR